MRHRNAPQATYLGGALPSVISHEMPYTTGGGLCPVLRGAELFLTSWKPQMRPLRALIAGVLALTAYGGGLALAQETSGGYLVSPAWSSISRGESALLQRPRTNNPRSDDLALGFTITGYAGVSGQLELGRVTLGPGTDAGSMPSLGYSGMAPNPVNETVGQASIRWNLTPRLAVSTSYSRDVADALLFEGAPVFEDTIAGTVTYAITPRFAVSAQGAMSMPSDTPGQDAQDFSGDGAELGAAYHFMPYFTGSVNYTYQSYDGQEGILRHDESTLSLSLTGRF